MKLLILLFVFFSVGASALDTPKGGKFDYRVKDVNYNPNDVVKLVSHFGYQIDIVFAEGETVLKKGIYVGDSGAWKVATLNNHLFVKPMDEGGDTNMTVLTDRRAYSFVLSSHWSKEEEKSNDMYFQVNFKYPQEEAERLARDAARIKSAEIAAENKRRLDEKMAKTESVKNWDYWVQGSKSLSPDAAYDDGRFTYLTFKGNRDIPAIFVVNEDGSESLINRHVEGDVVVVQTLAKKFVLRKGKSVACVFNKKFDPVGNSNGAGTTVPGVERVIKGEK